MCIKMASHAFNIDRECPFAETSSVLHDFTDYKGKDERDLEIAVDLHGDSCGPA